MLKTEDEPTAEFGQCEVERVILGKRREASREGERSEKGSVGVIWSKTMKYLHGNITKHTTLCSECVLILKNWG